MKEIIVKKKNGSKEFFCSEKIINAIRKSAERVLVTLTEMEEELVWKSVKEYLQDNEIYEINVTELHNIVETKLSDVNNKVSQSYKSYRNYKKDFIAMVDELYKSADSITLRGDKENSNTDSSLVSSKRTLTYNVLNKLLYRKFFLTDEEKQATSDGFIYCHDESSRRDTYNCCLFDAETVMKGGFELANMRYNECTSIDKALDVLGDIMMMKSSQQYGK